MSSGTHHRLLHAVCTYYGQWLPGDERGWRSRDHRIHSSGDYRSPPPLGEHEDLHRWASSHMKHGAVRLDHDEQMTVGIAFILKLAEIGGDVRCASCGPTHVHVLYDSAALDALPELGRAKQFASRRLTTRPGRIWGKGAKIVVVRDMQHARRVWSYILDHARKEGAWTWRYDQDEVPTR